MEGSIGSSKSIRIFLHIPYQCGGMFKPSQGFTLLTALDVVCHLMLEALKSISPATG
jgi:hypothetical protein